jgi:hypothetical protein
MDTRLIDSICKQIYRRFPEVAGAQPRIQAQDSPARSHYLFIFKASGKTENGKAIARVVRAVVSEQGKIIKVTTSH